MIFVVLVAIGIGVHVAFGVIFLREEIEDMSQLNGIAPSPKHPARVD